MNNLKIYRIICGLFPPLVSQSLREIIFPLKKARMLAGNFSKTSITGSIFSGNTSDDHSYRFAVHGFFDWRNIVLAQKYTKYYQGDIIEIGANVGTETISYCDLISPTWKVHAFEPLPDNILSLNKMAETLENLIVYPYAISNRVAIVNFQIPPKHQSGIGKIINTENTGIPNNILEVKTLPLDSYLDILKKVSLISIDTEGHEPFVLEGANEIINKFRPAVIIEVSPKLLKKYANTSSEEILHYFVDKNYLCYTIEQLTLKEVNDNSLHLRKAQNWFCIPKEKQTNIKSIKRSLFLRGIVPWYFLRSLKSSVSH